LDPYSLYNTRPRNFAAGIISLHDAYRAGPFGAVAPFRRRSLLSRRCLAPSKGLFRRVLSRLTGLLFSSGGDK
jgi:hypothetical protein